MSPEKKAQILGVIESMGEKGATVRQVADAMNIGISGVGRYMCELRDAGEIKVVGRVSRVKTPVYMVGNDASLCDGVDIFEQCRQNWRGYSIHKIFGSASRGDQVAVL